MIVAILIAAADFRRKPGEAPQGFGHLHPACYTGDHHVDHRKGRVEMAARLELLDRDAGGRHCLGIGDALVAQRIELAGDDQGRRQAGDLAAQRRDARIGAVGR